ncbi:hypothetical protein P43SY_005780 [Pythium insidiosum]|uniref:Cyclin-dependent kinase 2 homolog n=1 Tax=Pythium insidiosum TaxID=114742 RepID=A0AAD5QFD7_PYTIN|nr:hypothetical protein P43SY_005780 [Pythium insidiosum]
MMQQYDVIATVGNGAFGEVFKARHVVSGDVVAIKKLRVRDDGELRVLPAPLFQEIEALRQLQHTNIVHLHDVFVDGSHVALVMEFLETDLFTILRRRKMPFSDPEIRGLMRMLLQGVAYCHRRHILHRDLKPGNLLLDRRGELKLSDFGLATVYVGPARSYSHQVATRWYRAPELLLGARSYDGAVDMWAVGAIFAELLQLVPLFAGQSDLDQLYRIIQVLGHPENQWPGVAELPDYKKVEFPSYHPIPWREIVPDACNEAVDLLSRLLVLDPSRRLTAEEALLHPYFFMGPVLSLFPIDPPPSKSQSAEENDEAFLAALHKPLSPPFA